MNTDKLGKIGLHVQVPVHRTPQTEKEKKKKVSGNTRTSVLR